jgi:hypothetical protein
MDVLTLALACSLYQDHDLVRTLITDASHGNPFFVGDTSNLDTYDNSSSLQDAQKIIQRVTKSGGRPAVGLMGLPLHWAARFGKTTGALFDGCTNVSIGTAMLKQFEQQCRAAIAPISKTAVTRRRRPRPPLSIDLLRPCVLGHFGRELGIQNFVEGIMADLPRRTISAAARPSMAPSAQESPASWNGPGLFLEVDAQADFAAGNRTTGTGETSGGEAASKK